MSNPWRGTVELTVDGEVHELKLTLGALAELETLLGGTPVLEIVERMEAGQFSARDILAVILAGLRGGGWRGQAEDLTSAQIGAGPFDAARAAAQLIARAFSLETDGTP